MDDGRRDEGCERERGRLWRERREVRKEGEAGAVDDGKRKRKEGKGKFGDVKRELKKTALF